MIEQDLSVFRQSMFGDAVAEVLPVDEEEAARTKIFGHTLNDDGSLRCVSPSQHKNHKRCKRMWYYDKVMKLPRKPKSKGAKLGTECHGREEKYLKTGVDIRGPLERYGHEMIEPYLPRAPFNNGDMLVEAPLLEPQLVTPGGIRISGFSDVTLPPDELGLAQVLDHKFKKRLEQYADTREYLDTEDPQSIIYSEWAFEKWPEAVAVRFAHHNHQSEGARLNKIVAVGNTREAVFEKWRKLGKYIDTEMAATALKKSAEDVEAAGDTDGSKCRAYGGCDFLNICPSSPHNRFLNGLRGGALTEMPVVGNRRGEPQQTEGWNLMGLLDEMEAKAAGTAAPVTQTPVNQSAPVSGGPAALVQLEAQDCKVKGVYMLPGGAVAQFKEVVGDRAIFKNKEKQLVEVGLEATVRDLNGDSTAVGLFERKLKIDDKTTTPDTPPPPPATKPSDTTPPITQAAGIVPKDAPADTNPPKPTETTPAPAAATTTATTPPAASTQAAATTAATEPAKKPGRKPKGQTTGDQLIVLVNNACAAAEDLMPYVQGMCDALAKKAGIADVRLGDNQSDLGYGKWKALLTIMCKTTPPPAGLYTIAQTELSEPVIEALSTVGIVSYGRGK